MTQKLRNKVGKEEHKTLEFGKRKYACVECRQQKSKCDYSIILQNPCSRCTKKNIECVIQKDFKRTQKRARAEIIERKVKELTEHIIKSSLTRSELLKGSLEEYDEQKPHSYTTKGEFSILKREAENIISAEQGCDSKPQLQSENIPMLSEKVVTSSTGGKIFRCKPKTLGDVLLSEIEIIELFDEYIKKYHRFLPVVDIDHGPEKIYKLSPCLFWVIMLTALRHLDGYGDIVIKLSGLVKAILGEITISPIIRYIPNENDEPLLNAASVYSVQAFLIYSLWPPLSSSLSADTSWNTIGAAMFQAIRVGLNTTEIYGDNNEPNLEFVTQQKMTWICSNVVSQTIASSFGFPPYVSFDQTMANSRILSDTEIDTIPIEIKHMAHLAHFENEVQRTLYAEERNKLGIVDYCERNPIIEVFRQQLDQIVEKFEKLSHPLDGIRKFQMLVSKVHLLSYYFINAEETIDLITKKGMIQTYNAAIALLEHVNVMKSSDPSIVKYFPGVFLLNIWQSACIICKLAHSSLNSVLDVKRGKWVYKNAISMTLDTSIVEYDMPYRFSGIMRSVWRMSSNVFGKICKSSENNRQPHDTNLTLTVKSRMAVSVFFDILYLLKEKCGIAKQLREQTKESSISENITNSSEDEENARIIIKTKPLDPSPISLRNTPELAGINNGPSPNVLSLEGILNKTSPCSRSPTYNEVETQIKSNDKYKDQGSWDNWQSDTVWKDVDTLLNEFAFNSAL